MSDKAKYLAHVVDVGDFAIIEKELLAEAGTSKQEDDDDWEDVSEEEEDARFAKEDEKLQRLIGLLKVELFGAYAELANERDQLEELEDLTNLVLQAIAVAPCAPTIRHLRIL